MYIIQLQKYFLLFSLLRGIKSLHCVDYVHVLYDKTHVLLQETLLKCLQCIAPKHISFALMLPDLTAVFFSLAIDALMS